MEEDTINKVNLGVSVVLFGLTLFANIGLAISAFWIYRSTVRPAQRFWRAVQELPAYMAIADFGSKRGEDWGVRIDTYAKFLDATNVSDEGFSTLTQIVHVPVPVDVYKQLRLGHEVAFQEPPSANVDYANAAELHERLGGTAEEGGEPSPSWLRMHNLTQVTAPA